MLPLKTRPTPWQETRFVSRQNQNSTHDERPPILRPIVTKFEDTATIIRAHGKIRLETYHKRKAFQEKELKLYSSD
jgi:hypothetical protein